MIKEFVLALMVKLMMAREMVTALQVSKLRDVISETG